jgi:primosomal replication protein N
VIEAGERRKVSVELRGKAIGEITQKILAAELGALHAFAGFIGSQRNGRGVVFHIQAIELK